MLTRVCLLVSVSAVLLYHASIKCDDYEYIYIHTRMNSELLIDRDLISYNENIYLLDDTITVFRFITIDENGQYMPSINSAIAFSSKVIPIDKKHEKYFIKHKQSLVGYEKRGDALIPCYAASRGSPIVPIQGGEVLNANDYYYTPDSDPIFNYPVQFFRTEEVIKSKLPALPRSAGVQGAQPFNVNLWQPKSHTHQYVSCTFTRNIPCLVVSDARVSYRRMGGYMFQGIYKPCGSFLWDASKTPIPFGKLKRDEVSKLVGGFKADEPVYEFRSGLLVPGKMSKEYYFVPEIGSKILSFNDYAFPDTDRRIYNLPGKFVSKK